jgi:hypothetical protein
MPLKTRIHGLYLYWSARSQIVFLILTILSACYILSSFSDFQYYLSTGDHGRELYCYKKTMDGAVPYRDFSWLYGPFFLYYYALFYQLFGVSVQSVLLGQNLLILGSTALIYLICSRFLSPALAYICALWYLSYRGMEFFFSYHHSGGLLLILLILFCIFEYIRKPARLPVFTGFAAVLLLLLTRLNLGTAFFAAFLASLLIVDQFRKDSPVQTDKRLYLLLSVITATVPAAVYWLLIHPLPQYVINQTFPYSHAQLAVVKITPWQAVIEFFRILAEIFTVSWPRKIFALALCTAIFQSIAASIQKKNIRPSRESILAFLSLFIFLVCGLHEFIGSGVTFRLNWIFPIMLVILAHLFSELLRLNSEKIFTPVVRTLTLLMFFGFIVRQIADNKNFIAPHKTPERIIAAAETRIYTIQDSSWLKTVTDTLEYLRQHVLPGETIFCLPHDSLYNFLSGHDAPTRQLAFFEHTMITPEQEQATINDLESKHVQWVVISNRIESVEFGMGIFGTTHCHLLNDYLTEHFEVAAQYGDWNGPGGWGADHATAILKRKS